MSVGAAAVATALIAACFGCAAYADLRGERGLARAFLIEGVMVTGLVILLRSGAF